MLDDPEQASYLDPLALSNPIEVIAGTRAVVDGRTRLKAAREAGLESVPIEEADLRGEDAVVYMIRAAMTRRHLSSGQNAALSLEIEERAAKVAKERQRENARATAAEKATSNPARIPDSKVPSVTRPVSQPESRDVAANTNPRYVSDAKAIRGALVLRGGDRAGSIYYRKGLFWGVLGCFGEVGRSELSP